MTIGDARKYVGRNCWISWTDRTGQEHGKLLQVEDLQYVPMYGTYLYTDSEELNLDKITEIRPMD